MKKLYYKPEISFNDFCIAANFASICSKTVDNHAQGACGIEIWGSRTVFSTENTGCEYSAEDGEYDICYFIPSADTNLFLS